MVSRILDYLLFFTKIVLQITDLQASTVDHYKLATVIAFTIVDDKVH